MNKVAIIGGGISGLFFANLLKQESNYDITIYEKNNFINLEKGYGIQLSVNSIKLLNLIGFQNINIQNRFTPNKVDFYSLKNKKKICDLDISLFNTNQAKYTTLKRSTLVDFLKNKLPSNLMQYNKKIKKIIYKNTSIELIFEDNSSAECNYLIISDGVFSNTKSLIADNIIKPKYYNSIAIRGTINKKNLESIDHRNISLFLGSKFHSVIYPVSKNDEYNFIGIFEKKLSEKQLNDYSIFSNDDFISLILSNISSLINKNVLENVQSFPIFTSKEIFLPKQKNTFLIGDAFFAFPPSFAQGASQSIESAFELYKELNNNIKFYNQRSERVRMINRRSNINYFIFHLSNPFIVFFRDLLMKYLTKNKTFINNYLGEIYKK